MISYILALILFPFTSVWLAGNLWQSFHATNTKPDRLFCSKNSGKCEEGFSDRNKEEVSDGGSGFKEYNLLSVDKVLASGFMPVRIADARDLKLWAGSSVAIDVDSGTILHYDNGRKRTQIASLTKIMTSILALEKIKDLNEVVIIEAKAINLAGTTVGCPTSTLCNSNRLYPGEKVRAIDLLKATLMNSANDAAVSLAVHVSGSEKAFVELMNEKAKELGLKDTHFCTASGLEIDGSEDQCYSSAYDIARIAAYSLKHDQIWEIMRIPESRFYSVDGSYMHELKNTDILLDNLPNCIGGKTGFTPLAGRSLMLGVTDDSGKHKIIAVLLNDEKRWEDMRTLVNWVYTNYKWQ